MQHLVGTRRVKLCYTDGSGELESACKTLGVAHDVSDPGIPATNGIIERTVGIVKQGARTVLYRAGFPPCFWCRAAAHYCLMINCDNTRGESSYYKTHDIDFDGLCIPFGARVAFLPTETHGDTTSTWDTSGNIGVFAGYDLSTGYRWSGRYLVWDLADFINVPLLTTKVVLGRLASPHCTKQVKI